MTQIDRRTLIGSAVATAAMPAAGSASAQVFPVPADGERIAIWPGKAPGGAHVTAREAEIPRRPDSMEEDRAVVHVATPTLTIFRPTRPNGAALLLIPGGGYLRVVVGHEGYVVARRFAEAGYVCLVLRYRLPGDPWEAGALAPLQDAQRALRVARALGRREGFDPARVGVIGFSAGGHLAAWLTSREVVSYTPIDAIDRESAPAALAAYAYPVILMDGPHVHAGSREQLLGAHPTVAQMQALALDRDVSPVTPPVFLLHAMDDQAVPVENSLAMLGALRAKGVATECHLFETGGHGFGISAPNEAARRWPDLFLAFARRHGL